MINWIRSIFYWIFGGGRFTRNGVDCSRKTHQTTPKGAHVYSLSGIPASSLQIIDNSMDKLFADAVFEGYTKRIYDFDWVKIYIPYDPCTLSPESQTPCFKVKDDGLAYDQSFFDQDPTPGKSYVLAPEMVFNPGNGEFIVCSDESVLYNAVRHGAEHCIIFVNSPDYYERSAVHTNGIYHPLLPRNNR